MARNDYLVGLTKTQSYVLASVNVLFSLIGIFGNVLVFIVVVRNRRLHTVSNLFIISLAFADLLACAVSQPMYAAFLFGLPHNPIYSAVRKSFSFVSVLASISNLAAVTIDRYTAIVSPMMYQLRAKFTSAFVLLIVIWSMSLVLGIPSGIGVPWFGAVTACYTLVLLFVIFPCYVRIYVVARAQARSIARQIGHIKKDLRGKTERENIAAKTIGTVLVVFAVCWLPIIVTPMIFRYGNHTTSSLNPRLKLALKCAQTLALCSSALNPVIYSLKTKIFKGDLRKIFHFVFRCSSCEDKPEFL